MSITELDYSLLEDCLHRNSSAWEDFVDRFLGLVLHVVDQTAEVRGVELSSEDRTDLAEAVFRAFHYNRMELLRRFEYKSSLSSYLVVLTRRLVVAFLLCRDPEA